MKFRKKPEVVEAITFDELVEHGLKNTDDVHNGMPWSFKYAGHPITHEDDNCYLIPTLEGTMKFTRDDMLIIDENGNLYVKTTTIFNKRYEPVSRSRCKSR